MRKNFTDFAAFFPQPVLIIGTYDQEGTPNAMNVGWGGMCGSKYVSIHISHDHKTTENILLKRAFTMSFADQAHMVEADYFGLAKGHQVNKIEKVGFHGVKGDYVDAPIFEELPLTLECKVVEIRDIRGELEVVGEVVNMSADESILDEEGRVDADRLHPLSYDRVKRVYRILGGEVGRAYSVGRELL